MVTAVLSVALGTELEQSKAFTANCRSTDLRVDVAAEALAAIPRHHPDHLEPLARELRCLLADLVRRSEHETALTGFSMHTRKESSTVTSSPRI